MDYKIRFNEILDEPEKYTNEEILSIMQDYLNQAGAKEDLYSLNDPVEQVLVEYHRNLRMKQVTDVPVHRLYLYLAEHTTAYRRKEQNYAEAMRWNPADIDILFSYCTYLVKRNHLQELKDFLPGIYDFLYTRADLARYYRFYGYYYIECKEPQIAKWFYTLSQSYYETKEGQDSLAFLDAVPGIEHGAEEARTRMVSLHSHLLTPPSDNITLLQQMSKEAMKLEDFDSAVLYQKLAVDMLQINGK